MPDDRYSPPAPHELAAKKTYLASLDAKLAKASGYTPGRMKLQQMRARVAEEIAQIEEYNRSGLVPALQPPTSTQSKVDELQARRARLRKEMVAIDEELGRLGVVVGPGKG